MKKSKRLLALVLAVISVISIFTVTVFAADTSYSKYDTPESSGDYAYWNGKKVVKSGSTNTSEIKWMQASMNYLISVGYISGSYLTVDGSFGPASKAMCIKFQEKTGLSKDGSFGPGTIQKMKDVLNKKPWEKNTSSSNSSDLIWPIADGKGKVTHDAGEKRSYEKHAGADIGSCKNCSVIAVASGKVLAVGLDKNNARGYYVVINHDNGYYCVYQHLRDKPLVKANDRVSQGQKIGVVGNTGNSYGEHLHFEIAKYSSLTKTGSAANYLYNDIKNKKNPTYYSIRLGGKSGSYYRLNLVSHI